MISLSAVDSKAVHSDELLSHVGAISRKPSIFHYFSRAELVSYSDQFFFRNLAAYDGNDLQCNLLWVPSGVKSSINSPCNVGVSTEKEKKRRES